MKNVFKIGIIALAFILKSNFSQAQYKILFDYDNNGNIKKRYSQIMIIDARLRNSTSINEVVSDPISTKIYPNPASDKITIESVNGTAQGYNIIISNSSGSIVKSSNSNSAKTEMDISDLSNGVYYLELVADKKKDVIKLIITK